MPDRAITFRGRGSQFHADTCEPLKAAAAAGAVRLVALGRGSYPGRRLRSRDLEEVSSIGLWDADREQTWGLDWHRNEGIELTFLAAGTLPFEVDERTFTLQANDLTITRPWQQHRVGDPNIPASRLIWLILDVGVRHPNQPWVWPKWVLLPRQRMETLTRQLRQNAQPVWRADAGISRAFASIAAAVAETPANLTRVKIAINEVLLSLADLFDRRRPRLDANLSTAEHTVRLFLNELAQRAAEPWTLATMAAQCGLGRTAFSLLCRKLTNRTPIQHLTACRIGLACRLLSHEADQTITDIAYACGFQSSQYFATLFRRAMRVTPNEWRRLNAG
jgi:AraC family L-rhamnose operon regulatory protein RhaS